MSFDALLAADVTPKTKEVPIKIGDTVHKFTAHEIGYLQRLHLSAIQKSGRDPFTQLIVYSIRDEVGAGMTLKQAISLPNEIAEKFFIASSEVNKQEEVEKN